MNVKQLLEDLRAAGVEVAARGDTLVVSGAKGALTPEVAARLRAHKAEVLQFLSGAAAEGAGRHPMPTIVAAPHELVPLSFTQERLWYLSQVENNSAVFNLPLCLEITGSLDLGVLTRCFNELANRHSVMRSTVVVQDGVGFQRIAPRADVAIDVVDCRDGSADRRGSRARALAHLDRKAGEPFDLTARPPFRISVVWYAEEGCFLLIVIHHMFVDGASQNILLEELIAAYEAAVSGGPSALKPVPFQFADYAVWQRSWLQGAALDEQLAFWREALDGAPHVLELPADFPRPPVRGTAGAKEPLRLPRAAGQRLLAIAQEEGATPFMAMLALVNVFLHRLTGKEDILVGAPVANRVRRESEAIVGYIANTLVLRTDCSGSPSYREVVRRVRQRCIQAFRHQDVPFQKIVEALRPARDLSRTPIYQVFVTYDEVFVQPTQMGNLALERVIVGSTVARQDMSVFLRHVGDEIHGSVEYSVDLFRRDTILRFIEELGVLAESAAMAPDAPIRDLRMHTESERNVLAALNDTAMELPQVALHDLIASQAERTPDAIAVRGGPVAMTYQELMTEARSLAGLLRSRGVRPDDLVGICVERTPRKLVALLGILMTGAAYVPLDPDFPAARLAYMMEDAALGVIVCERATFGRVDGAGRVFVSLDDLAVESSVPAEADAKVSPDQRAYVIYTSGSTGQPKGVELSHRNVVNCLLAFRERLAWGADTVLVAVTTLSFDIAVLELFLPLVLGGTVVVASRDETTDGRRLAALLDDSRVTAMQATPATWRLLLDSRWGGKPGLRALCGGEALSNDLATALLPRVAELWNMYGPTETTVWSTCARVTDASAPIAIGTPVANTTIRIIDALGVPAATGVAGELFIGGAGVAKGYLGRAELTSERFVPDPARLEEGRFYRTGDLVRLRADGNIEHLGRLDNQVKIRGYRIELGEIEAALQAMPPIAETVAAVLAPGTADARLVAYVVYRAGAHPTVSEVRQFLRQRVPQYMVPALVVEIDRIPRTPNGKVDRGRLPNPLATSRGRSQEPPATPMERLVAESWKQVLAVDRVGRHDNFFELGGHSLLSMRVVAMLERETGTRVDPRVFFFNTVEQIAAGIPSRAAARAS